MQNYRILCVDDEVRSLNSLKKLCLQQNPGNTVVTFDRSLSALDYAKEHEIDIALLDIDMPEMNGLTLTRELTKLYPHLNVIMTTAYSEYALEAFSNNCSGYLLKPITLEALEHQFSILRFNISPKEEEEEEAGLRVRCFGNFEVFWNGTPVGFKYTKTRELLAYLVDRDGALCSNGQILATLWEDDEDHLSYLKQIREDLKNRLSTLTGTDCFITSRGFIGLRRETVQCDYYRYLAGEDISFLGEYMEQYSWAETTKANLLYLAEKRRQEKLS